MEVAAPPKFIDIFMFRVPVIGDAVVCPFEEASYKFWAVVGRDGSRLTIRETVGKVTLQRRIDNFIRKESGFMHTPMLIAPDHIEPAITEDVAQWAAAHPKEMESALW